MNSFNDMVIDKIELNDFGSFQQRIDDMNNWICHLDEEIHSQRRRLWRNFEDFVNIAHVIEKIMAEFGEDRIQEIIDHYMENERHFVLKKQRQMARNGELSIDFLDLDSLFSIKF